MRRWSRSQYGSGMSLFPHRPGSTSSATEQSAPRVSLPSTAPIAGSPRLASRVVGCGAAVLSAALVLTACGTSAPAKTSTSTPKNDKAFHSTAEAKKAAVDASQRFWDAFVQAQNDSANAEAIMSRVASPIVVRNDVREIQKFAAQGRMLHGAAKVEQFHPIKENFPLKDFVLEGVVCVQFKDLRWVDASGADVTSADRPDLQAIEVAYEPQTDNPKSLRVKQYGDPVDPAKSCAP